MKIYLMALLFVLSCSKAFSQSIVKTYWDPFTKTQLKEVYSVIPNTPIPNGLYKLYDDNAVLSKVGYFIKGKENGIWKEYMGGRLWCVTTYKNGKRDGLMTFYDDQSGQNRVSRTAVFKDDISIKETEYDWYNNGVKAAEHAIDPNHSMMGVLYKGLTIEYWPNGAIKSKGDYFRNDEKIGKWETFFENGIKESVFVYDSAGVVTNDSYYYLNGKLKSQETLDKPNLITTQIQFDSLTSIKTKQNVFKFKNEQLSEISNIKVSYFDNIGKSIQVIKTYSGNSGNIREGTWKEYFDKDRNEVFDTTKAFSFRIITYKSDQIIGKVMDYNMNGSPLEVMELETDRPVDKFKPNSNFIIYYSNGKTFESTMYDNIGLVKSDSVYNNEGKLYRSFEKKSVEGSITNFLITWYDNNGKPLRTKEIKISFADVSEGYKNLQEEYSK